MATGWARDGAVQEKIDASVGDAGKLARSRLRYYQEPVILLDE